MKNKDSCESWFVWIVKKARFENILYEPQNILKKQEVRPKNLTSIYLGWGGWIRTLILQKFKNTYNQQVAKFLAGSV